MIITSRKEYTFNPEDKDLYNSFSSGISKAIKMAREEEREKAIKALDIALMAIIAKGDNKVSFGDIKDQFDKILKQ